VESELQVPLKRPPVTGDAAHKFVPDSADSERFNDPLVATPELAVARQSPPPVEPPPDRESVSEGSVTVGRTRVPYRAVAGTYTMKDEKWYELVAGDHSRSGGQWDIWEATYGPVGRDGYPQRIWDKRTGVIDRRVAEYWKQHYDLRNILETNWGTLGPKVANNISVYVGDADSYFLNMGVHMLDAFFKAASNPKFGGEVVFQPMAPHCWGPSLPELIPKMTAHMEKFAPAGADLKSWRY